MTGITALIHGTKPSDGPGKVVMLRADMDALPILEENDVDYRSQSDGAMHACGHDAHTAMLLGIARLLTDRRDQFSGTVKLLFQPAEEGPGGASDDRGRRARRSRMSTRYSGCMSTSTRRSAPCIPPADRWLRPPIAARSRSRARAATAPIRTRRSTRSSSRPRSSPGLQTIVSRECRPDRVGRHHGRHDSARAKRAMSSLIRPRCA